MSNPARELHTIYESWQKKLAKGGSPRSVIGASKSGFDEALRAAGLLVRMRELIDVLGAEGLPVDLYRRLIPRWIAPLAAADAPQRTPGLLGDSRLLDEIEGFANFLEGKVPVISIEKQTNLRDIVNRAAELLESDDSLPAYLQTYIRRLLHQIRTAIDDTRAGAHVDVGNLAYSLWVAFEAAEARSTAKGAVWKDLGAQLMTGTISSALVQGATFAIAATMTQ